MLIILKLLFTLKPLEVFPDVKKECVSRLMNTVIAHFNQLNVVVNNAGISGGSDRK